MKTIMRYLYTPIKMTETIMTTLNTGKDAEKLDDLYYIHCV